MNFLITLLMAILLAVPQGVAETELVETETAGGGTPLVIIVPHGDDEITVLPEIQAAGSGAIVVVMTDGASTTRCDNAPNKERCLRVRRLESTTGFLAEVAPEARVLWLGMPDGTINSRHVELIATNVCNYCTVLAAGADYGHPDHTAVRQGVAAVGGYAYDGSLRTESQSTMAALWRWYGWLVNEAQLPILGLQ